MIFKIKKSKQEGVITSTPHLKLAITTYGDLDLEQA
jgi:hypothetical protein